MLCLAAAPVISLIQPSNQAKSGMRSLTLVGLGFSTIDPTATSSSVSLGICLTAAWTTRTAVNCLSSVYMDGTSRASIVASVTVQAAMGTFTAGVTFDGTHTALRVLPLKSVSSFSLNVACLSTG